MKPDRLVRVNELIRREIASNLQRFAHGSDVNLAEVTITRVVTAGNLRSARVWVSVLKSLPGTALPQSGSSAATINTDRAEATAAGGPSAAPKDTGAQKRDAPAGKEYPPGESGHTAVARIMNLLLDRRSEIQAHMGRKLKLKYTPRLFFEVDDSLEQGDRVLSILNSLADEYDGTPPFEEGSDDA